MGDQPVKKQLTDSDSGRDFISHLLHHIKDNILVRLPTEQAVRTCVLSKDWRYAWCTVPELAVFEKRNVDEESDYDCSKYVDMLLSNHKGPIRKFTLSINDPRSEDLDRWITVLGSKGVKYLDLAFDSDDDDDEIPPSLFSCLLDLTDLKLGGCILNIPKDFKGFKLLRNIELDWVTFIGGDLEKLVLSCPRLEDLRLVNESQCLGNVVIHSQSLEMLTVFSDFKNLLIEAPKLFAFYISPEEYGSFSDFKMVHGEFITIFKREIVADLLCDITSTQHQASFRSNYLTSTIVTVDISKEDDLAAALYMSKIAPRLQELYIKFTAGEGPPCISFWKSENGDDLFSSLKTITISSIEIDAAALILGFVAFVLRTAPLLEKWS